MAAIHIPSITLSLLLTLVLIKELEADNMTQELNFSSMKEYCKNFKNCKTCKKASAECEWCHDVGCTSTPKSDCPKKMFLDLVEPRAYRRLCTEITSQGPVFLPSNSMKLKFSLQVDDMTLYNKHLYCEFHFFDNVIETSGYINKDDDAVVCDVRNISFSDGVALGHVQVVWGGVEPRSNPLLLILYDCENMATDCPSCQTLAKIFKCGWCKHAMRCTLKEQCSDRFGKWVDWDHSCSRAPSKVLSQYSKFYSKDQKEIKYPLFKFV